MINAGYKLTIKEINSWRAFKKSEAYSTYLNSIAQSTAYVALMDEHINNVDITEDVKRLQKEGKLPTSVTPATISALFKFTLGRMAIGILADSIILKELEDISIEEIFNGLKSDSDISYLLGQADKKYYTQARHLLDTGKIDSSSLAYRGLLAFMRINNLEFSEPHETCKKLIKEETKSNILNADPIKVDATTPSIDLDSDNIEL